MNHPGIVGDCIAREDGRLMLDIYSVIIDASQQSRCSPGHEHIPSIIGFAEC